MSTPPARGMPAGRGPQLRPANPAGRVIPGSQGVRALWRRVVGSPRARTWTLYFPICLISSAMAMSTWDSRRGDPRDGTSVLIWLLGLALAASLAYRRRFPVAVCLIACLGPIATPLDPVVALIAFGSLAVRRLDRVTAMVSVPVAAATLIANYRDSQGRTTQQSLWQMLRGLGGPVGPDGTPQVLRYPPLPLWVVVVISAILVGLAFGLALLLRDRSKDRAREATVAAQQVVVDTLSDQLARQAERERIAREIHDALGHRLSMVALHAGALELRASPSDPQLGQSAALVRANAAQSMSDLRSLIDTLHRPDSPDVAAAVPTLRDVPGLIDETVATGTQLVSTVHLEMVEHLEGQTSRSAFRLTQELLTNARKHAPEIGIRVLVRAAPAVGVIIEVANYLPAGVDPAIRPGNGLTGAQTRVAQLDGDWRCWVDDRGVFRVAVHLPWVWEVSDSPPTGEQTTSSSPMSAPHEQQGA